MAPMRTRSRRLALRSPLLAALLLATAAPLAAWAASEPAERVPSAEKLALRLLNCTRTGGWVKPDGRCRGYGSGRHSTRRKALERHRPLGTEVAWPWAARLAEDGVCAHEIEGSGPWYQRFTDAGYTASPIAENIGCATGMAPRDMVIATHRGMQAEKSYDGGHWRNMKMKGIRSVGIAVSRSGDRTRVVYDFYAEAAP
jgi:hypothetical protein